MKKHRKLFKNFFLAVLCVGLVSSIISIPTHAADLYPDVSKLTTDWYYFDKGKFSTRSYYDQATNGVPYIIGLNSYTTLTGYGDGGGNYGYKFYGDNPWFTYLDNGTTALCNNSNDLGLTGYFWDGVGSYNNTLTLEFGVPSFVSDSTYIYDSKRQNYHINDYGIIAERPAADKTKYKWRLRSDNSYVNLVREKRDDDPTLKYNPHYFNDNDNFIIGLDLKQVGNDASGYPLFDGYVFVASPSGKTGPHGIASGVYVLDNEPLTKTQLKAETPLNTNHTATIDAAFAANLTTFENLYTSTPNTGSQRAWNPGSFVSFTFSTATQVNGLTTVSITVNGTTLTYTDVPNVQVGSLFLGAISQPCATYKNIKINGTVPTYTMYFYNGYRTGMSQTPSVSPTSKSISYGSAVGDLATASCLGYKTTASTTSGWYYDATNTITSSGILRQFADVYVEPHWTPITYYVAYTAPKPNGASTNVTGYTPTTTAAYDRAFYLSGTGYTLPGYKCNSGWKYSNGTDVGTSQVSNLTATDGATVALHHTWAPRTYTAKYNINKPSYATSSSGSTAATTHTFDSYNSLASNGFSCEGATFLGWSRNASAKEFNNAQSVKNLMTPTADGQSINMYAIWRPIQYYVRFNRNWDNDAYITGNTSVTKGKFDYGTAYSAIKQSDTNMSRQGYYIAYWTEKADGTGRRYYCGDKDWPAGKNNVEATFSNLTKTDGATVDLYAHWEPIPYTLVYHKNDSNGGTNPAGGNTASYAETTVRYYNDTKPLLANKWTRVNELNVPSVFRGWNLLADVNSTDNSVKYTARWSNTGNFVNGDSCTLCTTRDGTVNIYTVWDDVPVLIAQDYEIPYSTNSGDTIGDLVSRDSDGGLVLSQTALEEILLKNAVSKHSDREDGVLELGEHFFIKYFIKDTYTDLDSPTSFEVKYTVTDSTGNSYTQSAMLYGGYLIRIDIQ